MNFYPKPPYIQTKQKAISLLEIIVVISILLALTALLLPVFKHSKSKGNGTSDIEALRQLGVAYALYESDNGRPLRAIIPYVESRWVPKALVSGRQDPSDIGAGNLLLKFQQTGSGGGSRFKPMSYRLSFFGLDDFPEEKNHPVLGEAATDGWLADWGGMDWGEVKEPILFQTQAKGKYRRLTLEGSVILLPSEAYFIPDLACPLMHFFWYHSFSDAEKRERCFKY